METINDFFTAFSSFLWGWPMIILLLSFERRLPKNNRFSFMFEKSENSGFSMSAPI